ncbi:MAG: response regulator [Proteobacteria bacterium]|nr:response regulator [Pseudomonadota bacterium]
MQKILIIEDEIHNMKLATDILSLQGYNILQATNAEEGIVLAQNEQPHLILMDVELGGMDGVTATSLLKSDKKTGHIKIIVLTARAMVGDREIILSVGADDYLAKPYKYQELLSIVGKYCS